MINCPTCGTRIKLEQKKSTCKNGHLFSTKNGVYQITTPEFKLQLEKFLPSVEDWRKQYTDTIKPETLKKLPYVSLDKKEWKGKQLDLNLIHKLPIKKEARVLDLGAWNGWLSNQLAALNFEVTAIDVFIDTIDGLGANKHYHNQWVSIQMDMDNLDVLDGEYDLIIINRSLPYRSDLNKTLTDLKALLSPNGILLITGVNYYKNSIHIIERLKKIQISFEQKYNTPLISNGSKGYLDKKDLSILAEHNVQLKLYDAYKYTSILAHFFPKKPFCYYGIYHNNENIS